MTTKTNKTPALYTPKAFGEKRCPGEVHTTGGDGCMVCAGHRWGYIPNVEFDLGEARKVGAVLVRDVPDARWYEVEAVAKGRVDVTLKAKGKATVMTEAFIF